MSPSDTPQLPHTHTRVRVCVEHVCVHAHTHMSVTTHMYTTAHKCTQ